VTEEIVFDRFLEVLQVDAFEGWSNLKTIGVIGGSFIE
jgi:hypothetical protein